MAVEVLEESRVLRLRFSGVVTPAGLRSFIRETGPSLLPALAGKADLSDAVVAAYPEHLTEPFRQIAPEAARLLVPVSINCRPDDTFLFAEHARQSAELGVVRVVFNDPVQALAWTHGKAAAARLAQLGQMMQAARSRG
jgi:hypothetical protein